METFGIVSEFYVARNVGHGVVVAAAGPPDGLPDVESVQRLGELRRCVVAAPVGVKYGCWLQVVVACGHGNRGLDQRRLVVVVHGPADDGFGVTVEYRGEVDPAFPGGNVGDVADHFHARCLGGEVAGEQVGDRPGGRVGLGEAVPPRLRLAGDQ